MPVVEDIESNSSKIKKLESDLSQLRAKHVALEEKLNELIRFVGPQSASDSREAGDPEP